MATYEVELVEALGKMANLLDESSLTVDTYGVITTPGKFEREHYSILYWHDAYMNGDGESHSSEGDPGFVVFDMNFGERILFEGIIRRGPKPDPRFAVLSFSDVGFEGIEYMDEAELHDTINAYERRFPPEED